MGAGARTDYRPDPLGDVTASLNQSGASLHDMPKTIASTEMANRVHVQMDTHWNSPKYAIRPREAISPLVLLAESDCGLGYARLAA